MGGEKKRTNVFVEGVSGTVTRSYRIQERLERTEN